VFPVGVSAISQPSLRTAERNVQRFSAQGAAGAPWAVFTGYTDGEVPPRGGVNSTDAAVTQ